MTLPKPAGDAGEFDAEQLARSSYSLADAFGGVVLDAHYKHIPHPSILPANYSDHFYPQPAPEFIGDVELCPYAAEPEDEKGRIQLNVFAHAARNGAPQISLTQIRHWYTIAKALHRSNDYLRRIAAIGHQFKQTYGEAAPDCLQLFTDWQPQDVEHWLWDLSVYEQRLQASAITNADDIQLGLFD